MVLHRIVPETESASGHHTLNVATLIQTVTEDLKELNEFYNISISSQRAERLRRYLEDQLTVVSKLDFKRLSTEDQVDAALLHNYLNGTLQQHRLDTAKNENVLKLVGSFATTIIELCEARQHVADVDWPKAAGRLMDANAALVELSTAISKGHHKGKVDSFIAYRAAYKLEELQKVFEQWYGFYAGYDPMFDWWLLKPYEAVRASLSDIIPVIRKELAHIDRSQDEPIVGEPIGRNGVLADLMFEKIAYSPEELTNIGESEYQWCESEAKKAAHEMGFGSDWRKALERVKNMYVEPGKQITAIRDLAYEATAYVKKHDLITVPEVAEDWRMYMIEPKAQKTNPFFLGGPYMQVSYPTNTMSHEDKLMSMRGNSIPLSRSTVFHELIPGHHLQYHMIKRHRPYRRLFDTPFWMEGWALYWEFILWDKGFPDTPENRIGMLFWRMHRCCRIVFSLKFHLGQMTPQDCIDYLVEKVGHERATAEGEVRRSFNGDYRPLYQAGYMLGALQLYALRHEQVEGGSMTEKEFHDRVLQENEMPIEVLRASLQGRRFDLTFKPSWRFYDKGK